MSAGKPKPSDDAESNSTETEEPDSPQVIYVSILDVPAEEKTGGEKQKPSRHGTSKLPVSNEQVDK